MGKTIARKEIESVMKNYLRNKKFRARWLCRGILPKVQRRLNTYSSQTISKIEMEGKLPNSFYEVSITLTGDTLLKKKTAS